jgi:hypothetical protein
MTEKENEPEKPDYWIEIASFIVLVILSALSQVWYIVIAIAAAILLWRAAVLLVYLARAAAGMFSWGLRAPSRQIIEKLAFQESGVSTSQYTPERGLLEKGKECSI